MKKIFFTVFVFLSSTLAAGQTQFTCDECKKDEKAWCMFTSKDGVKTKLCVDKNGSGICLGALAGTVSLDCVGLSDEDKKTVIVPLPGNLPKSCGTCIADGKKWCVSDLLVSKAKFCVPFDSAGYLCLNGKVHEDCKVVGENDAHAHFFSDMQDCGKCVEGSDKTLSWCVIDTNVVKVRTCLGDTMAWLTCAGGKSHKSCDALSDEHKTGVWFGASGTTALSSFVAVGVFFAAVMI